MKWHVSSKIRLMLVGFAVSIVLCGGQSAKADFTFGEPTNLGATTNSSAIDNGPSLSADSLTLYFVSRRLGGEGGNDIWLSRRSTTRDPWTGPVNLGPPVNSSYHEHGPQISPDGLMLYFSSERPGGQGSSDLWMTERPATSDLWGTPVNLGPTVNSSAWDGVGSISADGLKLFLSSSRSGGYGGMDLWLATRPTKDDEWATPMNLGPTVNGVNSTSLNYCPTISADGLLLVFSSDRPGGYGGQDLWVTRRSTTDGPWSEPVNLGPTINSGKWEVEPEISPDGRSLLFCSGRNSGHGDYDIWRAPIVPPVGNLKQDGDSDSAVESDKSNGGKEG